MAYFHFSYYTSMETKLPQQWKHISNGNIAMEVDQQWQQKYNFRRG